VASHHTGFHPVLRPFATDLSWAGYNGRQHSFLHAARVSLHGMRAAADRSARASQPEADSRVFSRREAEPDSSCRLG
jgi:hypothetical protein